jgi:hypothetical protein
LNSAILYQKQDAWFALSAVSMQTEAVETKDGYTVMVPPSRERSDSQDEDVVMEGAGEEATQAQGAFLGTQISSQQREFLLWELVNCLDSR